MKDGLRFVDCDMHIMEPPDLFEQYLDPQFKDRVILPIGADGRPRRGMLVIDGVPASMDTELQQYRKRSRSNTNSSDSQPLSGSRIAEAGRLDFAMARNYNAEAQVMGMEIEGIDIAVLFPTTGLSLIARDHMDPHLSLTPKEYFRRNCWAAVEGSEPEIEATARLIGADRMCISTDSPHLRRK